MEREPIIEFRGDRVAALGQLKRGKWCLGKLKEFMKPRKLEQLFHQWIFPDGTHVKCWSVFGIDRIDIYVPPKEVVSKVDIVKKYIEDTIIPFYNGAVANPDSGNNAIWLAMNYSQSGDIQSSMDTIPNDDWTVPSSGEFRPFNFPNVAADGNLWVGAVRSYTWNAKDTDGEIISRAVFKSDFFTAFGEYELLITVGDEETVTRSRVTYFKEEPPDITKKSDGTAIAYSFQLYPDGSYSKVALSLKMHYYTGVKKLWLAASVANYDADDNLISSWSQEPVNDFDYREIDGNDRYYRVKNYSVYYDITEDKIYTNCKAVHGYATGKSYPDDVVALNQMSKVYQTELIRYDWNMLKRQVETHTFYGFEFFGHHGYTFRLKVDVAFAGFDHTDGTFNYWNSCIVTATRDYVLSGGNIRSGTAVFTAVPGVSNLDNTIFDPTNLYLGTITFTNFAIFVQHGAVAYYDSIASNWVILDRTCLISGSNPGSGTIRNVITDLNGVDILDNSVATTGAPMSPDLPMLLYSGFTVGIYYKEEEYMSSAPACAPQTSADVNDQLDEAKIINSLGSYAINSRTLRSSHYKQNYVNHGATETFSAYGGVNRDGNIDIITLDSMDTYPWRWATNRYILEVDPTFPLA